MPFTLAHPAAVLPFLRQPFIPLALVAGAMAPDLPYFAMVSSTSPAWYAPMLNGANSHDLAQILTVGLPLALLVAGFLWLVAKPLRWALPKSWVPDKPALKGRPPTSARVALWTFYSLMLGLLTHLAWDAFTHSYGWVVQRVPFLASEPMAGFPVYGILQHASSLAGLVILGAWYLKRIRASRGPMAKPEPQGQAARTIGLGILLVVPAVAAALLGLGSTPAPEDPASAASVLWLVITRGGAAAALALAAYGLVWQLASLILKLRTLAGSRP